MVKGQIVAQTSLIGARSQLSSSRGACTHIPEIFHGTQMLQDKMKPLNDDCLPGSCKGDLTKSTLIKQLSAGKPHKEVICKERQGR